MGMNQFHHEGMLSKDSMWVPQGISDNESEERHQYQYEKLNFQGLEFLENVDPGQD